MRSDRLADIFDDEATRSSGRLAICHQDRDLTYGQLLARSLEISRVLAHICDQPGCRVGLMLPNSPEFVAAFFAVARVDAVIVPVNVRYRHQELIYYLRDSAISALIVAPDSLATVRAALEGLNESPAIILLQPGGYCDLLRRGKVVGAPSASTTPDPLLLQYTSGSTGTPKRVIRTHSNLRFELDLLQQTFSLTENDRFLGLAPFSHVNGLVRTMMTSMFVGGRLYTMESFRRREVLNILAQDRITYFGGVPYMFLILAETVPTTEVDLSHLRVVFSASAPLVAKDNNAFHSRYGIYVRQLYGSTETGTISVNLRANIQNCLESVGTPLTGIHVKVHNENGRFADVGEEGEIVIASPAAIRAYEGNESATRGSFRDGYYLSGDLGRMDCDGNLWLTGRKALLINRGGFKVNPFEVEKAIRSYEKVRDVVVLGTPSRHGDDIVRCIVVPAGRCTAQEIIHHCEDLIADYKIPTQIEFRTELPRSSTGKLLRHGL